MYRNRVTQMVKYRLIIQAAFTVLTNGYVKGFVRGRIFQGASKSFCVPGLNCYSCPGSLGSCPIGALQAILNSRQFSFSCYIFGFLMAVGILVGRLICGFLCPFGLVQDLLYKIPYGKKRKNIPGHNILKYLKYVVLAIFVIILPMTVANQVGMGMPWFCKWICPSGTLFGGIPLVAMNPALQKAVSFLFTWKVLVLLIVLILSMKIYRPFCKYLCPLGAIYSLFNPISILRLKIDPQKCIKCGACQKICKIDIRTFEQPNSPECIRCGNCIIACPCNAIQITSTHNKTVNLSKTKRTQH